MLSADSFDPNQGSRVGSNLFDTQMVFLKDFQKVDFEDFQGDKDLIFSLIFQLRREDTNTFSTLFQQDDVM